MASVKRSISDINLDKNLSISSPDLLTTVIRENILTKCQMWLTTNGGFGDDSTQIIANL